MKAGNCAGFSIPEVALASVIFAIALGAASAVSQSSLQTARASVLRTEEDSRASNLVDRLEEVLSNVGRSTLEARPSEDYSVPEPLVDGVAYENLEFRRVLCAWSEVPTYSPASHLPPYRLYVQRDGDPSGSEPVGALVLEGESGAVRLLSDVLRLEVTRTGNVLSLTVLRREKDNSERILTCNLVMRSS